MKGGFNEKGFLEGVAVKEPSLLVDKRAVCILLECFLTVYIRNCTEMLVMPTSYISQKNRTDKNR